jgi:hypothetical protein
VRPARPSGHGGSWDRLAEQLEVIKGWLYDGLTATKVHMLPARPGLDVPYRTLRRYVVAEFGFGRKSRPWGSRTVSRGPSCRWTSGGWGCCWTR